jgi:Tfp pilus assembly protein PilN
MILCLIILIAGIALLVPGAIVLYKTRNNRNVPVLAIFATMVGAVAIVIAIVIMIACPIESKVELNMFLAQKEYIENYEPTSEYDMAAIINKKIELNQWLYEEQYVKEYLPICSFYGDEILELEPIK